MYRSLLLLLCIMLLILLFLILLLLILYRVADLVLLVPQPGSLQLCPPPSPIHGRAHR